MHEVFEHTADLGLRVRARALDELFADAAHGLFSMIVTNLDDVAPVEELQFTVEAAELEYLLFDWLNELLYTFETQRIVLAHFRCNVDAGSVHATARGEPLDLQKHQLANEVKAITYHNFTVEQTDSGWLAEIIVDI